MRQGKILFFSLCLLAWWLAAVFVPLARADGTILIYHRFGEERWPTTNVPLDRFRRQLDYLREHGYRVVPLAEIAGAVRAGRPIPDKTVAITVDDGYLSTYTVAWPLLRRYGYPFTVFLYVEALERGYRNFLTWDQVREMAAAGVDFQDHSYGHPRFGRRPAGADDAAYRLWVEEDLRRSRRVFAKRLGQPPRYLALPYGEYNRLVLDAAAGFGYEAVFSQDPGAVSDESDILRLPREPILGREWSTLDHFAKVINRRDLPLADFWPGLEPLRDLAPPAFGARIRHPERYRPGSFAVYVSELGWRPARVKGDRVWIDNDRPLGRRQNRVMVSAREKETGRVALRFWLLIDDRRPAEGN